MHLVDFSYKSISNSHGSKCRELMQRNCRCLTRQSNDVYLNIAHCRKVTEAYFTGATRVV